MKKFFKDYKDLCKHCGRFYKDHWVATLVLTAAGTLLYCIPFAISAIKKKKYNECIKLKEELNSTIEKEP